MRERRPSREEREVWRNAMRDVRPLREEKPGPEPKPAPAQPKPAPSTAQTPARPAKPQPAEPATRPHNPPLAAGAIIGVDRRLAERLKRGRLPIDATLDLHGFTQVEAHAKVMGFIPRAVERGLRTVLIVTGKGRGDGGGVLKASLPRWLNEASARPHILAFAPARPEHGGTGALYILLRRKRVRP